MENDPAIDAPMTPALASIEPRKIPPNIPRSVCPSAPGCGEKKGAGGGAESEAGTPRGQNWRHQRRSREACILTTGVSKK